MPLLKGAYEKTFKNLIEVLGGRTAVLPLSGGHDSRLIAYYLHKLGYKKIIAYSYGRKNNEETRFAEQVANVLSIPFYFVEFDSRKMQKWAKQELRLYYEYACNAVSLPCAQETYAVWYLKTNKLIPDDAVFVPGYSGGFMAGSHLQKDFFKNCEYTKLVLFEHILGKHFVETQKLEKNSAAEQNIYKKLNELSYVEQDSFSKNEFCQVFEEFDLKERQAKFIQNAVRTYEFYGFQWITPEFDKTQFDTWLGIAPELRLNKKVFFDFEKEIYPDDIVNIQFAGERKLNFLQKVCRRISNILLGHPHFSMFKIYKYWYLKFIKRDASINSYMMTQLIDYIFD